MTAAGDGVSMLAADVSFLVLVLVMVLFLVLVLGHQMC